jgi:hypothetical protein
MNDLSIRRASFLWAGSAAALFLFVSPLAAAPAAKKAGACEHSRSRPVSPVSLTATEINRGWILALNLPPCPGFTDVLVQLDDQPEENLGHDTSLDGRTGKPRAHTFLFVPSASATPIEHRVRVRMVRLNGTVEGPYTLRFSPRELELAQVKAFIAKHGDSMIGFAEHREEETYLMFTALLDLQDSLREIRYSVDGCGLGERIGIEGVAKGVEAINTDNPFLMLPQSTRSACVQVVFRDGTLSQVLKLQREPRPGGGKRRG